MDLLVLEPSAERRPRLVQILQGIAAGAAAGLVVRGVGRVPEMGRLRPGDIAVIAWDELDPEDRETVAIELRASRARAVLVSAGLTRADYIDLFGTGLLLNLVACDGGVPRATDLAVTVARLLDAELPPGISPWLGAPVEAIENHRLGRASERAQLFEAVSAFATSRAIPSRFATLYRSVADELVTNAIYNAPVDSSGGRPYAHVDRTDEVVLDPGKVVEVELAKAGGMLGISVRDPFGSLTIERLTQQLSKCFARDERQVDDKPGGAGLGLYQILDAASHLVVEIDAGKSSELIVVMDVSGTYKDFLQKSKSFNVFLKGTGPS